MKNNNTHKALSFRQISDRLEGKLPAKCNGRSVYCNDFYKIL